MPTEPTTLQFLTWQVLRKIHSKACDGSAAHAKIWCDLFGTAGITKADCLVITVAELENAIARHAAARLQAKRQAEQNAAQAPPETTR